MAGGWVAAIGALAQVGAIAQTYEVRDLGDLGGGWAAPWDISDGGSVVGASTIPDQGFCWRPFLFDGERMVDLGTAPPEFFLGDCNNEARAINGQGQILAKLGNVANYRTFIIEPDGTKRRLPVVSGAFLNIGYGINEAGDAAGVDNSGPTGFQRPWVYRAGVDEVFALPLASDPQVPGMHEAFDINDTGVVAGYTEVAAPVISETACIWDANNELHLLGALEPGLRSAGRAINNLGEVVGWVERTNGIWGAGLFRDGEVIDLGSFGGLITIAEDINDRGEVVGFSQLADNQGSHAFVWQGDQMLDLNDLIDEASRQRWELSQATAINNSGQIVVLATDRANPISSHALLLTPIGGCPADLDGDGDADADDFFAFLDAFASGGFDVCDQDGDGDCDADDFFAYLDLFTQPC